MARVHAHSRSMGSKMDSLLYPIFGSLLRNHFVSPLNPTDKYLKAWKPVLSCPQVDQQQCVFSRFFSLLLPLPTAAFSTIVLANSRHCSATHRPHPAPRVHSLGPPVRQFPARCARWQLVCSFETWACMPVCRMLRSHHGRRGFGTHHAPSNDWNPTQHDSC